MIDGATFAAIAGMALATYATRLSGFFLWGGLPVSGRLKAGFDALPPAILMAVIAPTILATGVAETCAAVLTALAAYFRLPAAATITIGVASVVILRTVLN